jgi:hypothetical protein
MVTFLGAFFGYLVTVLASTAAAVVGLYPPQL